MIQIFSADGMDGRSDRRTDQPKVVLKVLAGLKMFTFIKVVNKQSNFSLLIIISLFLTATRTEVSEIKRHVD